MALRDLVLTSAVCMTMAGVAAAQTQEDFDSIDADGDGFVTLAELEAVFTDETAGEGADAAQILELNDTDGDGMISREEAGADGTLTDPDEAAD